MVRVASAVAASALEDFLGAAAGEKSSLRFSARNAADVGEVGAAIDALACASGVTRVAVADAMGTGDPESFANAVRDVVDAVAVAGATLVEVELRVEANAFEEKTFWPKARAELERTRLALGNDAACIFLVSGDVGSDFDGFVSKGRVLGGAASGFAERGRRLRQAAASPESSSYYSNGNVTETASKTNAFRDVTSAFAVFFFLLIAILSGFLAMTAMSFPTDSLLYPREKNE